MLHSLLLRQTAKVAGFVDARLFYAGLLVFGWIARA